MSLSPFSLQSKCYSEHHHCSMEKKTNDSSYICLQISLSHFSKIRFCCLSEFVYRFIAFPIFLHSGMLLPGFSVVPLIDLVQNTLYFGALPHKIVLSPSVFASLILKPLVVYIFKG